MSLNATKKKKLCLKCQACCKVLYIPTSFPRKEDLEFYKARGVTFGNIKGVLHAIIPSVCPQLTKEGCSIYDKRPEACMYYDGRKDPLLKDICLWKKENQGRIKK